ncbi:MAG TPA: type IV pilus assembly protein PilM, partial [Verrucomicrobiae bacterium]
YGFKSLGLEGVQEATREAAMQRALQEIAAEKTYTSKGLNICAPGFHTFSKFVKLPPVDTSKVTQIIQYEAQQNVPFPLEEVVWDYQILGAASSGELEVLLVAIKSDVVEGLFRVAETAGYKLHLVDVSPAALCNAFRYNYGDLEGCTMLLDIGAKTSNLLFFEKGNVYSRGINIGANTITQDFAKESKLSFEEAEKLKIEEGFVSLGGAYEEPENPNQAAISKIARQVMTRLHIQVNQTVQHYKQQGGSAPQRLFLSGGAAIMPYTAQFFSEKLNVPVEYFNPFRNVQIDPALNLEELAKVAHTMGEVVGLGLRNLAHCPVELNLMPKSSLKRQSFNQKKPYLVASVFCLILILFACGWFYERVAEEKNSVLDTLQAKLKPLQANEQQLKSAMRDLAEAQYEADQFAALLADRQYWPSILTEMRGALMRVEAKTKAEFGPETGVWIERFVPVVPPGSLVGTDIGAMDVNPPPAAVTGSPDPQAARTPKVVPTGPMVGTRGTTNEINTIVMQCRALNLKKVKPDANSKLAFAFVEELKAITVFVDPTGTQAENLPDVEEASLTFTFDVTVKLKRPLKL